MTGQKESGATLGSDNGQPSAAAGKQSSTSTRRSLQASRQGHATVGDRHCAVKNCERSAIAKGLCSKHYDRLRRYGTTDIPARQTVCSVEDCDNPVRAKGLCNKHYKRKSRYGTTAPRARNTRCTQPDCDRPHLAKGLCRFHYDQQRRAKAEESAGNAGR